MRKPPETVLDEIETLEGSLELVAYKANRRVWVGIRWKGSPSHHTAIELHSGSVKHSIQASASIHVGWGVAFGAVSPNIDRVEIRNDRGELSPGRIIPLPSAFDEDYRAAWGVTECEKGCDIVGYDDRDRAVEWPAAQPSGPDLSPEERLQLVRKYCDHGIRYYTWALSRMQLVPEQTAHIRELENQRVMLAHVLAYVEGARDDLAAQTERDRIVQRYITAVENEGWEPRGRSGGSDLNGP